MVTPALPVQIYTGVGKLSHCRTKVRQRQQIVRQEGLKNWEFCNTFLRQKKASDKTPFSGPICIYIYHTIKMKYSHILQWVHLD